MVHVQTITELAICETEMLKNESAFKEINLASKTPACRKKVNKQCINTTTEKKDILKLNEEKKLSEPMQRKCVWHG